MGKSSRDKGNRGERYVVRQFKDAGFTDATRNYADKVDGQGVDVTAGTFRIQVKNYKGSVPMSKIKEIQDNDGFKLLVSNDTSDRSLPWLVTMSLNDFLQIMQDIGLAYDTEHYQSLVSPF